MKYLCNASVCNDQTHLHFDSSKFEVCLYCIYRWKIYKVGKISLKLTRRQQYGDWQFRSTFYWGEVQWFSRLQIKRIARLPLSNDKIYQSRRLLPGKFLFVFLRLFKTSSRRLIWIWQRKSTKLQKKLQKFSTRNSTRYVDTFHAIRFNKYSILT